MKILREVLNVFQVAAKEPGRYAVNNAAFESRDGKNIAVATNGRSLIKYEIERAKEDQDEALMMIPADTVKKALKIGIKNRPVEITRGSISAFGDSVQVPPLNEKDNKYPPQYPQYEQIFKANADCDHYTFTFDAVLMIELLEAMVKVNGPDSAGSKKTIVTMKFQENNKRAAQIVLDRGTNGKTTAVIMPDEKE